MKKAIWFLALLFIPLVMGYSAGNETIVSHFDICESLVVDVTGELNIIDGEYWLLNCTNLNNSNVWDCNCTDEYTLMLQTLTNTVNTYTFEMDYEYIAEEQEDSDDDSSSSGSSGGSGGGSSAICDAWKECQPDGYQYRDCRKASLIWTNKRGCDYIPTETDGSETVGVIDTIEETTTSDTGNVTNQIDLDKLREDEQQSMTLFWVVFITFFTTIIGLFVYYIFFKN